MRRREFITLLGGAVAAWPLVARAQAPRRKPHIGFVGGTTKTLQQEWTAAFVQRLTERGWTGQTVSIEYRWAEARKERLLLYLKEFVDRRVDVIVTHPDEAVLIAKEMTSEIPIVFPVTRDPLSTGVVSKACTH